MKAYLILQDGTKLEGESIGAEGSSPGELVFNTGMTGYQEVLTDPSYYGQIVTMTYPLIGNYGINSSDSESDRSYVRGFIVRETSETPSNFRSEKSLSDYLKEQNIVAISGVDTRALTIKIRNESPINALITTRDISFDEVKDEICAYKVTGAVKNTTCKEPYTVNCGGVLHAALLDFGLKRNIIRSLTKRGINVTVFPADTNAETILACRPDGIMLSNGPGDPADCIEEIKTIKELTKSGIPIFGICLGHQLTAIAMGGKTAKMKFGHRGSNHPVKDLAEGKIFITSQNHGYAVIAGSLPPEIADISHINQNDLTVEGVRYKDINCTTVQFHPEASPGPKETAYLFDRFKEQMTKHKGR